MRPIAYLVTIAACFVGMASGGAAVGLALASPDIARPALPEAAPAYHLVLLVNLPDGRQTETTLATLPEAACLPAMRAIWRANADAPLVGIDEVGPIPAFDAVCLP